MNSTDALQEGRTAPTGITTSEPDRPARISPASLSTATHSNRSHPTILPPTSTRHHGLGPHHAAKLRVPPRGREDRGKEHPKARVETPEPNGRGPPPPQPRRGPCPQHCHTLPSGRSSRGIPGHLGPAGPISGPQSSGRRAAACRQPRRDPLPSRRPATAAQQPPARPDPDGTRRAQIWAWRAPPARATATPRRRPAPAPTRAGPSPPDSTTCATPAPRRSCSTRGIAPGRRRRGRPGPSPAPHAGDGGGGEEGGGAAGRPRRGRAGREREGGAPDVDFPNSSFSRVKFKPIADDQTISAVFFNPEIVKPIPRLLDNVVVPDKTVTESDIPKRPLWHTYRGSRPPPVTCKPETLWKASTPAMPREEVKNAGTGWIGRGGGSAAAATVVAERRQIGRSSYGKGRDDGEMLPHRSGGSGYGRGFRGVAPAQSRSGRLDAPLDGGASSSPPGGSWVGGGGAVQTSSRPVGTWARGGGRGGRGQPRAW